MLLEAGPDLTADLPEELQDGWHITRKFDWGYTTEHQELGTVQKLRRGKTLGGTAWYTRYALRGSAAGYDQWERLGNPGWSFEGMLPYLKRLENDLEFGDQPWHGDRGPIPITRYPDLEPSHVGAATMRAYEAAGFPSVKDHNEPGAVGAARMPMNSRQGKRVIAAQVYLPQAGRRQNLTVRAEAEVDGILFEGTRAAGIKLIDGTTIGADCVVLAAGAYGSPSILMRSGVGPAEHLRSVGIATKVDLRGVGEGLGSDVGVDVDCGYRGEARNSPHFRYVATFHSGETSNDSPPDLMLWPADPYDDPPVFTIDVALLRPRSRGRVQLRSSSPADPPRIELQCLTEPADLIRLTEGYRRAYEVAVRPELRELCSGPVPPEAKDALELQSLVRKNAYPLPHVFGTCVMGPSPDEGAVVDSSGRVFGTERLFVVDASIMPSVPSGFTHIPTIALAERLSERITASL